MSALEVEALELHEAIASPGPIRDDGLVPLHVIRPGIGRGRGRHLYEADMLEHEAGRGRFNGWKMYLDHLDPVAKKKAGGMPRSIKDLGGVIKEAWWDPNVPANPQTGHGQGAVVALAKVNRFMRALIEDLPEAVGASISATATGVKPVTRQGQQVWLVEGINPRGSVDWVTEAGAGGRVVSLMEALEESWADDEEVFALLENRSDEEIVELLREEGLLARPGLRAALQEAADAEGAGGDDELSQLTESLMTKFKGNRKLAEITARRQLAETNAREGGDVDATELLQEALETEEGQALLETAAEPIVEKLFRTIVAPRLGELIEAALEDERELMQAESNASADRRLQLRDLRDLAHSQINEARLPEPFKAELRARYSLVENAPTAALDVVDDDPREVKDGETAKSAEDKLREAVAADLALKEEQFAASRPPTRVVGQGERKDAPTKKAAPKGEEGKEVEEGEVKTTGSALTDFALSEAGVEPDSEMYAGIV